MSTQEPERSEDDVNRMKLSRTAELMMVTHQHRLYRDPRFVAWLKESDNVLKTLLKARYTKS